MREGILSAGNWVYDHVKIVNTLPEKGMLASILQEEIGGGGAPYNVLVDLAKMDAPFPLHGAGLIGKDHKASFLINELQNYSIDTSNIHQTEQTSTSYTDVMTEKPTGDRTFFHYRGTNALLSHDDLAKIDSQAKIFHLGYLLLLDSLDQKDEEYGVVSAKTLHMLQKKGFKTSVDVVSESGERFKELVTPALKYINYLIINEIEAERISGLKIRSDQDINKENLLKTGQHLIDQGVQDLVVIHFPEGGFAISKDGSQHFAPSFQVDQSEIIGTNGAGDAFCAGMLYAIHENKPLEESLKTANACARFNLLGATSTGGMQSIDEVQKFMQKAPLKKPIIQL